MVDPLILWDDVSEFLSLLERTGDIHVRLYPRKEKERREGSSDTGISYILNKREGKSITKTSAGAIREIEAALKKPEYQEHSLGIVINPGGTKATEIKEGRALFFEADGGLSLDDQLALPARIGLPQPTFSLWSGSRSVHHYWVAAPAEHGAASKGLPPAQWKQAQERLIAAVKNAAPEAGVDESLKDLPRVMRAPGGIHPATGDRAVFLSYPGDLFDLAALMEMLPKLPEARKAPTVARVEGAMGEEVAKALDALAFLPPLDFTSYGKWLGVGMALHSVSEELLPAWTEWSRGMGEAFNEEEHGSKWATFSSERDASITLGSLIHWAKDYGYRPPVSKDTSTLPTWSELISLALEAVRNGDVDTEMELRAEIAGRFRRNDSQVDAALFRLLTEQEAGPKKRESADSVDLRTVQGLDYLVDGYLPANGLTLSYGSKGVGKTTSATGLSFAVIEGRGFLDHSKPAKRGKVLFIASDSGAGPLRTILQNMGHGDHPALVPGEDQQFFVWAHEAEQGHSAWDVSVRGCVKLLQFVKAKGIDLVVIDSAKAVCAKAGLSYTDNDAVNALLTFVKEVITPHTSVLFLSHDGTAVGSHAGAKAWAEIVDVVHRQTKPEGDHHSRTWTVVKNRLGPTREFSYALEDGELVLAKGVETIGDASTAILTVLREGYQQGHLTLSRKGIHEEVFKRFDFAPKTIDNTLQRLVQGKAPKVVRKGKGWYGLSPKELYRGCLVNGEESTIPPVPDCVLPITRALPVGNECQSSIRPPLPEPLPVGNGRVMPTPLGTTEEIPVSSPRGTHPPKETASIELEKSADSADAVWPSVSEFESAEIFQQGFWLNGWVVGAVRGEEVELFRSDDSTETICLDGSLVRACRS